MIEESPEARSEFNRSEAEAQGDGGTSDNDTLPSLTDSSLISGIDHLAVTVEEDHMPDDVLEDQGQKSRGRAL